MCPYGPTPNDWSNHQTAKRGDRVWHKVFAVSGIVLHATSNLAYVRWSNGTGTECNVGSLRRVSL